MPVIKTGVPAHDAALIAAEQAHQAAIVGATAAQTLALSPGGAFVLRAPHHVHEIGLGTA